jgi:hypothetical protein
VKALDIIRAKVQDEHDIYVFTLMEEHTRWQAELYKSVGPNIRLGTEKMWANHTGLHVKNEEGDKWTVYPWHRVLWYEEVR